MLVIMHDRNIHFLLKTLFYIKTLRSLDVFEVYTSKSWLKGFDDFDKFLWIFFIDFNVKNINVCKDFKQNPFAFHYGFTSFRTNIS